MWLIPRDITGSVCVTINIIITNNRTGGGHCKREESYYMGECMRASLRGPD